jgi:hypothetical protein
MLAVISDPLMISAGIALAGVVAETDFGELEDNLW